MDTKGAVPLKPGQVVQGAIPAVDVLEWPTDVKEAPSDGKVESVKLIPWQQSALKRKLGPVKPGTAVQFRPDVQSVEVNEYQFDRLQAGLPTPVRRTASQRYDSMVKRLLDIGRANTVNGRVIWPASIQRILDTTGVKNDADIYPQVFALARHFIQKAENKQRANDARQVTRGWHGHYD